MPKGTPIERLRADLRSALQMDQPESPAQLRRLLTRDLKRPLLPGPKGRVDTGGTIGLNRIIDRRLAELQLLAPRSGISSSRGDLYRYLSSIFALVERCAMKSQLDYLANRVCAMRNIGRRRNDSIFAIVISATSSVPKATRSKWARALDIALATHCSAPKLESVIRDAGGFNEYIQSHRRIEKIRGDADLARHNEDEWGEDDEKDRADPSDQDNDLAGDDDEDDGWGL